MAMINACDVMQVSVLQKRPAISFHYISSGLGVKCMGYIHRVHDDVKSNKSCQACECQSESRGVTEDSNPLEDRCRAR